MIGWYIAGVLALILIALVVLYIDFAKKVRW